MILLPQCPECWDYRHASPFPELFLKIAKPEMTFLLCGYKAICSFVIREYGIFFLNYKMARNNLCCNEAEET
jgi:hypothetical protein